MRNSIILSEALSFVKSLCYTRGMDTTGVGVDTKLARMKQIETTKSFLSYVRKGVKQEEISKKQPLVFWSSEELYEDFLPGSGLLASHAKDFLASLKASEVANIAIMPYFSIRSKQIAVKGGFDYPKTKVKATEAGFTFLDSFLLKAAGSVAVFDVLKRTKNGSLNIAISSDALGEQYTIPGSTKRLLRYTALGFGGYYALELLGVKASLHHLASVNSILAVLVRIDRLMDGGLNLHEAICFISRDTILGLDQSIEREESFSLRQFEAYVLPNLHNKELRDFIKACAQKNKKIDFWTIAEKLLHKQVYFTKEMRQVAHEDAQMIRLLNSNNEAIASNIKTYFEQIGLEISQDNAKAKTKQLMAKLEAEQIRELKRSNRYSFNRIATEYHDQYGKALNIPADAKLITIRKEALFDDDRLLDIFSAQRVLAVLLEDFNAHIVIVGAIDPLSHYQEHCSGKELAKILTQIHSDKICKERIHYVVDADERFSNKLSQASNISLNTTKPESNCMSNYWMSDLMNLAVLVAPESEMMQGFDRSSYVYFDATIGEDFWAALKCALEVWESDFDLEFYAQHQLVDFFTNFAENRNAKTYLQYVS